MKGIFILGEIRGEMGRKLRELNERFDPKLARSKPPHLTITGSSGVGPLRGDLAPEEIQSRLQPVAASTPPLELTFAPPTRFMQSNIIVLPLDPHGPLRLLHDLIATSGLPFARARFTFTPHATLSLYPTLAPDALNELLALRISESFVLDAFQVYLTSDPQPARKLLELHLSGLSVVRHESSVTDDRRRITDDQSS